MVNNPVDPKRIDAMPTKDFFISMLVRDIDLVDAIADLFDNCVDGARRMKPNGKYDGLTVRIKTSPSEFSITDNCGGIPVEVARSYAFRFGRPEGMPPTRHGIGQFGIGMKRALFKLGRKFVVESKTKDASFKVRVDVDEWKKSPEWNFAFDELEEAQRNPSDECGTKILVTDLNEGIANSFGLENFKNTLREKLEAKHRETMAKGLEVRLNTTQLRFAPSVLLQYRAELRPAFFEKSYTKFGSAPVLVELWVGVANSDPNAAGWYVYCNERLVLGPNQTELTGWGDGLPRFHNQYGRFRGYAYFDCEDPNLLPWNTTKNSVEADSELYRAVRQQMVNLARPVIDFLNALRREERESEKEGPLFTVLEKAKPAALDLVKTSPVFVRPAESKARPSPRSGTISYSKPLDEIAKAQKVLKVSSRKAVGEKTFDYFYKAECSE
jgi:Histidine kinase-, DNA gyrase B-, and HSP90-like ATPase